MKKTVCNKTGSYLTFKIGNEEYGAHVITGLVNINDHFIMILDLKKLFTYEELKSLKKYKR